MPNTTSERRSSLRAPVDGLANRYLGGYPYLCRLADISPTGMRVTGFLEPKVPQKYVGVQFELPGISGVFSASGEIVFENPTTREVRLRFTKIPPSAASAIKAFLVSSANQQELCSSS